MATKIWDAASVTPAATDRIPVDVSSSGAPSRWTGQNIADAPGTIGVTTQALGSINTNTTITWSSGSYVTATIAGALTFTFAGAPSSGQGFQGVLVLTNGGSATITWPGAVTWMGGTAPTLTASGVNVLYFVTSNGGTNWYGWTEYDEPAIAGSDTQVLFNDGGVLAGDSGFTFNKTNNTIDLGGATVTASDPVLDLSQTWNSAGVTFTGWKINITDTASSAGSLLADLQVAGTSRFAVQKTGNVRVANGTSLSSMYARFPDYFGSPAFALSKNDNDTSYVFHVDTFGTVGYVKIGSTAAYTWASAGTFGTNPTIDLLLFRDAAGTLAQRNGTNAQTFRVYRSYTDASNYSRWTVKWNTSTAILHAEGAGTGTDGSVAFNDAALATDATRGFLMIPSCAGTPTGTPADIPTGQAPIVYDSTNKKLCVWDGAAWVQTAALT